MVEKYISLSDDVVYSTYPEFEREYENTHESETLPPEKQMLIISLKKRKIDGVLVTKVSGFVGKRIDLMKIEQELQAICRTTGAARMDDITLFRDVRGRAYVYLRNEGYGVQLAKQS